MLADRSDIAEELVRLKTHAGLQSPTHGHVAQSNSSS